MLRHLPEHGHPETCERVLCLPTRRPPLLSQIALSLCSWAGRPFLPLSPGYSPIPPTTVPGCPSLRSLWEWRVICPHTDSTEPYGDCVQACMNHLCVPTAWRSLCGHLFNRQHLDFSLHSISIKKKKKKALYGTRFTKWGGLSMMKTLYNIFLKIQPQSNPTHKVKDEEYYNIQR